VSYGRNTLKLVSSPLLRSWHLTYIDSPETLISNQVSTLTCSVLHFVTFSKHTSEVLHPYQKLQCLHGVSCECLNQIFLIQVQSLSVGNTVKTSWKNHSKSVLIALKVCCGSLNQYLDSEYIADVCYSEKQKLALVRRHQTYFRPN